MAGRRGGGGGGGGPRGGGGEGGADFASWVFRRGSVPVWWGVEIQGGGVGKAEIQIKTHKESTYHGTARYFRRLVREYFGVLPRLGAAAGERWAGPGGGEGPIVMVNLLRCAIERKGELMLSEHFQNGVRAARASVPGAQLRVLNFDWHANNKSLGMAGSIEGYWGTLAPVLRDAGINSGRWRPSAAPGASGALEQELDQVQVGVTRYNCADSLDRTNAAGFFVAVHAAIEQARALGLDLHQTRQPEKAGSAGSPDAPLPDGWEAKIDPGSGKVFYVDHNSKTTTWTRPAALAAAERPASASSRPASPEGAGPWGTMDLSVAEVKEGFSEAMLIALSELFQLNGDLHAMIYTGSRAMHSSSLFLLYPEDNKQKKGASGKAADLGITLKRRFLNVMSDGGRQQQFDIVLGVDIHKNFPTAFASGQQTYDTSVPDPESDAEDAQE